MSRLLLPIRICPALLALCLTTGTTSAQEAAPTEATPMDDAGALSVELNDAAPAEGGCRLTFLVENALGSDLSALSLETAILTTEGQVQQVTLFDFGDLPESRPRVRQFDLPELSCEAIGQVLVNDVAACEGAGVAPGACLSGLGLSSRTGIELLG
jgi:hypothetical protein